MRRATISRSSSGVGVLLTIATLVACGGGRHGGNAPAAIVSGTVTYRPRIALPPDAVVRVWVQDASSADSAPPIAEQVVATDGRQVPIPFAIQVDPSRVEPNHRYVVRAEIRGEGTLLWATDTAHAIRPPSTDPTEVAIVVVQPPLTPAGEGSVSTAVAGALVGPNWRLVRMRAADGRAVTPGAHESYTIEFDSTGRYAGQAYCNHYGGEYQPTADGKLELRRGLTTLAACPPPSSADAFMSALNAVTAFSVAGDELRLTTSGRGSLVFGRAAGR